jgi:hypothetical protein
MIPFLFFEIIIIVHRDSYEYYSGDGHNVKERSLCSRDLGHGEGRGRWVWNNYLRATYE